MRPPAVEATHRDRPGTVEYGATGDPIAPFHRPGGLMAPIHSEARGPRPGTEVDAATVLVVDDEDDIRFLARLHLERVAGFLVVGEATDGVESVTLADELQPDIVLLDVMMPRMDGPTALPELQRVAPRSMVVMVSALAASLHEHEAIAAGAFGYVEKGDLTGEFPGRLAELHERFRRALDGQTVWAPERPPQPGAAPAARSSGAVRP